MKDEAEHVSAPAGPAPAATLDPDVMRSVVAIAETGSVAAAALRVGRTPAAISMQIKKLEGVLGATLFARSRHGMEATAEGERLLPHARRLIEAERAALEAFRGPALSGPVRIGVNDDFAGARLSLTLAAFARSHPEVAVEVVVAPTKSLAPELDRGALDLAVLTPGCATPWRASDRLLHEEPLVWAVAAEGDAARKRPLPLAVADRGCAWRRMTLEALERAGIAYRAAYVSDFYDAQRAAVAADLAVAALPRNGLGAGLGAGIRPARPSEGLPALGAARVALRMGPEPAPAAQALGERIASIGVGAGGASDAAG